MGEPILDLLAGVFARRGRGDALAAEPFGQVEEELALLVRCQGVGGAFDFGQTAHGVKNGASEERWQRGFAGFIGFDMLRG